MQEKEEFQSFLVTWLLFSLFYDKILLGEFETFLTQPRQKNKTKGENLI